VKVRVILNPYADRWKAQRRADAVHAALLVAGLDCELIETTAPGHATDAAATTAMEECDAVVAAGGDGTVNEVVNGLVRVAGEGPTRPLGILPLGTGNDFAEMAGIPRDLSRAAAIIAAGNTRRVDAGRVRYAQSGDSGVTRYFVNNCAVAMEPLVTIENTRIGWLSGSRRYIVSLLRALRKLTAWQMRITWDDGSYEGSAHLFSVCNGPRCGGVFHMAPDARLDDGLFDFVFAPELSKLKVLRMLPHLFHGTHVHHAEITYKRARRITIESNPGTPIHADGELLTESATRIDYEILPGKLTLLLPPT
jgi:diacylglycerol kinase (ATP)